MTSDPWIGRTIGSYRLLESLGEGGMAVVYRAVHTAIEKEAALKLLKSEYCRRPETVARFFHEAKSVNQVRHENLIDIFDFGETPQGERYIVMELLRGASLSQVIDEEAPLPEERLARIGLQLCSALSAAHQRGIIHRDLKGGNIYLVTRAGQKDFAKILDFGIARILGSKESSQVLKTQSGAMLGTPLTMSPEQARGEPVGPETDIYALGVLLYQMATGSPPFYDESPVLLALKHVSEPLTPPRQRREGLSASLEEVIVRCLEKDRAARYRSMEEVALALSQATGLPKTQYAAEPAPPPKEKAASPTLLDPQTTIPPIPIEPLTSGGNRRRLGPWLGVGALLGLLVWLALASPEGGLPAPPEPNLAGASSPGVAPKLAPVSPPASAPAPASGPASAVSKAPSPATRPQKGASKAQEPGGAAKTSKGGQNQSAQDISKAPSSKEQGAKEKGGGVGGWTVDPF